MSSLEELFANLDEKLSLNEIKIRMKNGENPEKILSEVQKGLRVVGKRFELKQYALIELEMAEELFRKCTKTIKTLSGEKYSNHNDKSAEGTLGHSDTTDLG
jgi:methanogenic corrinoid protein MtbC1|tara:strand:- start:790 stop:1095 length:306 start_codon:yes stop_codon:yes gene_type:complete